MGFRLIPGLVVVAVVSTISVAIGAVETRLLGRPLVEPLVVAILVGMAVRAVFGTAERFEPGIRFAAKQVLEVAVFLLGATMDVPRLFASGPLLAIGIVLLVCAALGAGYTIGRFAGLSPNLSILVASGNAICGNSAIAAVAPVIGADREDVAASIALTAVLGVVVVLLLPLLVPIAGLTLQQYGVLAGLTVYSVPQVLAAAFAVSAVSGQIATVVKLARVLMLGPVVTFFAVRANRTSSASLSLRTLVPWFVFGFVVLAIARSMHMIPDEAAAVAKNAATWLTIAAMAALGLSVDLRAVRAVGTSVIVAATLSLGVLLVMSLALIFALAQLGG
jgi:uncharacterized integral membrane protein (TIGR00698 family)